MSSRLLNEEFHLPKGFYRFNGRPPLRAADPGQETGPRIYIPGKLLSWYGTQTVKAYGVELLAQIWFRQDGQQEEMVIWSGHQLPWISTTNTLLVQSPGHIPELGPGWVWVDFQTVTPETTANDNAMWEIQLTIFYLDKSA